MTRLRVGIVSDTHGLVREAALEALRGSDVILHAGDIGKPCVLEALAAIAPVHAIRGNVDRERWARDLPERLEVELAGRRFLLVHDRKSLDALPDADIVVSGHSHSPDVREEQDILWVNPGSIGPRRFRLPVVLARMTLEPDSVDVELVPCD